MLISRSTTVAYESAYQEMTKFLKALADEHGLSSIEILAIAANMVGKLIAMQDQQKVTPDIAMQIVSLNIEAGNAQAIAEVSSASTTRN